VGQVRLGMPLPESTDSAVRRAIDLVTPADECRAADRTILLGSLAHGHKPARQTLRIHLSHADILMPT
jgi:hypothetical protein